MRFPFLTIIVIFATVTYIYMKKTSSGTQTKIDEFLKREREANSVRKKSLDDLKYVTIDLNALPMNSNTHDERVAECQETVTNLADKKIVNLSAYSNTDLKFMYGVANLPLLTEYDQNFTSLSRALFDWGERLKALNNIEDAVTVLEYGIECGTDLKTHYILLADIYVSKFQFDKIERLIKKAEHLNTILKNSLVKELEERRLSKDSELLEVLENIDS